jgi:NitT/TauT family transport system permease protein
LPDTLVTAAPSGPLPLGDEPAARRRRRVSVAGAARLSRKLALSTIGLLILAALWQVLPSEHVIDPTFVTPLDQVVSTWWHLLQDGTLWANTEVSLVRAGVGFGIAIVLGVPLGLLIGWHRLVADVLNPVLDLFRNTAPLAILPVFILILGIGQTSKFVFVAYTCLWPIMLNTISAVKTVDPLLIKSARSLGYSQVRVFQKVVLPASVPTIFTGIRLAGSYALLVLIAAELVGANSGLGFLITDSEQNFAIPTMYAAIITVSLIGVILNVMLLRLERRFSNWRMTP